MRAVSALALLLAALPYVIGFLSAPHGKVFLGSLNNVGDTGQYLAALRQGAAGRLLYVNQYTALRVAPVLMYPLYTGAGLLLSPFHLPPMAMYLLVHVVAALALLAALWRFCRVAFPARPLLAYVIAVFGGGLYLPALLLSGIVALPFAPVALTAPEFSLFATLLISPHGALGLAAELWALGGYLNWRGGRRGAGLGALALGGLALGLSYPFGVAVLLSVVVVDVFASRAWPGTVRGRAPMVGDLPVAVALLPCAAVALYYGVLFRRDPLWGASNMVRLPPPSCGVVVAAFGLLLLCALPSARRAFYPGGAGRLLVVWAIVNPLLLLAPLPQSERLLSGWSVPLAILAAATLARASTRGARRLVLALSLSNVMLVLLYALVTLREAEGAYYTTTSEQAAINWLAAHSGPRDVVMASALSGNLIVPAMSGRVVVGQNFETFDWAGAQSDVHRYFAVATTSADRAGILRRNGVTLVLAGPYERGIGAYTPVGKGYRLMFTSGPVRVFAVRRAAQG